MDKKYLVLFKDLAESTALSAEQVMDYNKQKEDETGYQTAQIMRDNYQDLKDRMDAAGDDFNLNKADAAKLVVASIIFVNQLQDRVANMNAAIQGYTEDLIPKLRDVVDNSETDEDAIKKANEAFIITEEELKAEEVKEEEEK